MDVITKVFLSLIIIVQIAFADDLHLVFDEANLLYQQGKYEQAIDNYQNIIDEGLESGPLYFNLGNAYYKLNQLGAARLNYERATEFLKNDEDLEENINLLKLRLVDQIDPTPKFILNVWWDQIVDFIVIDGLIWIVAGLFWLVIVVFSIRYYYRSRGRGDRLNLIFMSVMTLFILFTLISVQKIYNLETEQYGIIMKSTVTSLAEPKPGATEVFILHEGTKIKIERIANDWFEIRLEDGKTGWLEGSDLEII